MQFWGFDKKFNTFSRKDALLQTITSNTGGGAGAARNDRDLPAPHRDDLQPITGSDDAARNAYLARTGTLQQYVVEFQAMRQQAAHVNPNPNQIWSYRGTFTERDGVAGVSNAQEAQEVEENIRALPQYDALNRLDPNYQIRYYVADNQRVDSNGSTVSDADSAPDIQNEDSSRISGLNRQAADALGLAPGTNSVYMSTRESRARLREMARSTEREIQELMNMIAQGNWEMIRYAVRALVRSAKISSLDAVSIYRMRQHQLNENNSRLRERYAGLTGNGADRSRQSTEINNQIQANQLELEQIPQMLNDTLSNVRDLTETSQNVTGTMDRISSIVSSARG